MNTYEDVAKLADWDKFVEDTNAVSTHGECHQFLTWLAIQIKKAEFTEYNMHLCTGSFAGMDHSWLQVEDEEGDMTIIDMTVDQFGGHIEMPYIGPMCPGYEIRDSVCLCETDRLQQFVENLG